MYFKCVELLGSEQLVVSAVNILSRLWDSKNFKARLILYFYLQHVWGTQQEELQHHLKGNLVLKWPETTTLMRVHDILVYR